MTSQAFDAQRTALRTKLTEWTRRYLFIEVIGTVCELGCAAVFYMATGSLAVAAVAATIGANVGYYGPAWWRGYRTSVIGMSDDRSLRHLCASVRALWCIAIEFGPGEIVDSLMVRPALFYAVPAVLSHLIGDAGAGALIGGWVLGKVLADIVFYACTIVSYELNKSRLPVVGVANRVEVTPDGTDVS